MEALKSFQFFVKKLNLGSFGRVIMSVVALKLLSFGSFERENVLAVLY